MLRDHARRAVELQHESDRHVRGNRARRDRVEGLARGPRKQFAVHAEARRARRNEVEDPLRHDQLGRLQRGGQRIHCFSLIRGRFPLHGRAAVAAHRVDILLPRHHRRRAFHGVAVIHPDRHQRFFADAVERGQADLHQPVELVGLIDAVRPLLHARMNVRVLVGEVPEVLGPRVVEDLRQGRRLAGALREFTIAVVDRDLVPVADPRRVRIREIDRAVVFQHFERMRVVHHRDPALAAVVVVVAEADRVADFVRRELADARERRLIENVGLFRAGLVRRQETFEDHVILAVAQRAERHRGLDDLARARIRHAAAGTPAARRAVHPVDHVVADVHRVGAGRQDVHLERVRESSGVERLTPPARAVEQRLPHVLRRARVHVVLDGLHRVADDGTRICLLQAMAADVAHDHRIADRCAVVHVAQAAIPGARVIDARLVVGVRQLDQRDVLAQCHRVGRRRHAGDRSREQPAAAPAARAAAGTDLLRSLRRPPGAAPAAGRIAHERERHVDLGVLRKVARVGRVERAAREVEAIGTQPAAGTGDVTQEERRGVDQHAAR